jgi:hypothetical protein
MYSGIHFELNEASLPLKLNDSEMSLLLTLSAPIDQRLRPDFLRAVAVELETRQVAGGIGEGAIHRVARTVQRQFWQPPAFGEGRR